MRRHARILSIAIAALAAVGAVCAGLATHAAHAHQMRTLLIRDVDFRVIAPRSTSPGRVVIIARNDGKVTHELLLAKLPKAGSTNYDDAAAGSKLHAGNMNQMQMRMPMVADGIEVDEDAVDVLGSAEDIPPGTSKRFTVDLTPGRYIVFCNMAGHFMSGMEQEITVR